MAFRASFRAKLAAFPAGSAVATQLGWWLRLIVGAALFLSVVSFSRGALAPLSLPTSSVAVSTQQLPFASPTDLRIEGRGYFVLKDSDGELYYTRWGNFVIRNGYLVSLSGFRVQGVSRGAVGDLPFWFDPFDPSWGIETSSENPVMDWFEIMPDGQIRMRLSDGTAFVSGQILLEDLASPEKGIRFPNRALKHTEAIGASGQMIAPGAGGRGSLKSTELEWPRPRIELKGKVGDQTISDPIYSRTRVETDLAIYGPGYFVLRDPATGTRFASRAGSFYWDTNGFLMNYNGMRVQGLSEVGTQVGDVRVEMSKTVEPQAPWAELHSRYVDWSGNVQAVLSDGTSYVGGQILLRDALQPERLVRTNFGLYAISDEAGEWSEFRAPGKNSKIFAGHLEMDAVDASLLEARKRMNFFTRGSYIRTDKETDFYIHGVEEFFTVRDPDTDQRYATRNGRFQLDSAGHLVTGSGFRVQGITNIIGREIGDIVIGAAATSGGALNLAIDWTGSLYSILSDGSVVSWGIFLLQEFRNPHALIRSGEHMFSNLENSLPKFEGIGVQPGSHGTGELLMGAFEEIPTLSELKTPPAGANRLRILDATDGGIVEASSDLIHWTELGPLNSWSFLDCDFFDEPGEGMRFYRVRIPDQQIENPSSF